MFHECNAMNANIPTYLVGFVYCNNKGSTFHVNCS